MLDSCCLLNFSKFFFFKKKYFRNTIRVSNSFNPNQDGYSVGPGLDSNCLQRFSADKKVVTNVFPGYK